MESDKYTQYLAVKRKLFPKTNTEMVSHEHALNQYNKSVQTV